MAVRDLVAVFLIAGVLYPSTGSPSGGLLPSSSSGSSVRIERVRLGSGGQWVELKNHADSSRDLRGWRLRAGDGAVYEFGPYRLGPGKTVRVHTGEGRDSRRDLYGGSRLPALPTSAATVTLRTPESAVDSCRYSGEGDAAC
ncbi:lamin tail domain-containing protein [Actinocorallia sp. A-T 12471]|uniref:lamin tail domain-containing protein n=1 Tax=Actinocorallia sp. A-T 12471 TaxID=3089813 RepID=UPI0029D346E9|nr:lamin tail domain-containing protein [Actinocorallia sp. A-T 12471]MDX6740336.1 lamin tail domain-containing protein [Actinocorallia sp. A-T 12471]